jgi:hypothetical protein
VLTQSSKTNEIPNGRKHKKVLQQSDQANFSNMFIKARELSDFSQAELNRIKRMSAAPAP